MTTLEDRAKTILLDALEIASEEDRLAYVEAQCTDDEDLRREVDDLLAHAQQMGDFLESVPPGLGEIIGSSHVAEEAGTNIGRYKLLELIGEGGFGAVYMAEQQEPIHRQVALKIIKLGMDTKQVVARFEAERQALAMMDHPNIAQVHDAGATATGRPYFVMELVRGVSITEYCDGANLSIRDRIGLFFNVCYAVEYAHMKGVIHRDIKPSNVMVTLHNGSPVPKIIDFGIAKATQKRLAEKTSLTSEGHFLGTPQYMSPEQAGMSDMHVDIRTDVYSLGVLLYELLVGRTPFDAEQLRQVGYDEVCRIIKEEDPPTPSKRLTTLGAATTEIATRRQVQPAVLRKLLCGDLDCIVMKALEKDRDGRYNTAQELADDLRRHLQDLPIQARRPSFLEKMIRKSRRHRAAVVTAGIVLTVVVVGSIVSAALLWNEQRKTVSALALAEDNFKAAQRKAQEAKAITEFLVKDLLGSVDPKRAKGRKVTVDEVLANAEAKIGTAFEDEPLIEAAIRYALARVCYVLGRYPDARSHIVRAIELRSAHLGTEHADTVESTAGLARMLWVTDELEEARKLSEQVLEARQRIFGPEHEATLDAMSSLAIVLNKQGELEEALRLNEQVLDARERILGPDHEKTLASIQNLAGVLFRQQKLEEARKLFEQALETTRRTLGPDHPHTLKAMHNLAGVLMTQNDFDRARELQEQVIDAQRRVLGPDHPDTLFGVLNLFRQFRSEHKLDEARRIGESLLDGTRRTWGPDDPQTLAMMNRLGAVLKDLGDLEEARKLFEESLEAHQRVRGPDHPDTLGTMAMLGSILSDLGELEEARKLLEQVLDARRRILGPDDGATLTSMTNLATVLAKQQKSEEAGKLFEESLEAHQRVLGPDHPDTCRAMNNLATFFTGQNQFDRARTLLEQVIDVQPRILGPDHPDTLSPKLNVVNLLRLEGKLEEAQTLCESVLEDSRRILGPEHHGTITTQLKLINLLDMQGKLEEAFKVQEQRVEMHWKAKAFGPCHFATFLNMGDLIAFRVRQGGTAKIPGFSAGMDSLGRAASIERAKEISPNIFFLATAYWHLGDREEARRWYDKAVEWMDEHKPNDKELSRFRDEAAKLIRGDGEENSERDQKE